MMISAEGAPAEKRELFARRALKDGRTVVDLRGLQVGGECVIEVDVYPVTAVGLEPLHLGPYALGTLDEAVSFVEEALLALEYLGCSIHGGSDDRRLHAVLEGS
jgi:hypothetical protein